MRGYGDTATMHKLAVFGTGPLFLALVLGACSSTPSPSTPQSSRTTAGRSAPSSSTSPTTGPLGSATPPSSPLPVPTSSATRLENFDPWNAGGAVSSSIQVNGHLSGGTCTQSSAFDVGNPEAWRCTEPSGAFLDPCFAPPGRTGVAQVACGESPWSSYTVLALSQPLAKSSWGTPADNQSFPWAMTLANGQQCGLIDGTGAADRRRILQFRMHRRICRLSHDGDATVDSPVRGRQLWTFDICACDHCMVVREFGNSREVIAGPNSGV